MSRGLDLKCIVGIARCNREPLRLLEKPRRASVGASGLHLNQPQLVARIARNHPPELLNCCGLGLVLGIGAVGAVNPEGLHNPVIRARKAVGWVEEAFCQSESCHRLRLQGSRLGLL